MAKGTREPDKNGSVERGENRDHGGNAHRGGTARSKNAAHHLAGDTVGSRDGVGGENAKIREIRQKINRQDRQAT